MKTKSKRVNGELGTRRDKRMEEENAMAKEEINMMSVEETMNNKRYIVQLVETHEGSH